MIPDWKAYEYSYRIHWSPDDRGYIAFVAEFPALQSPAADTPGAALDALMSEVIQKLNQLKVDGEPMPPALALAG